MIIRTVTIADTMTMMCQVSNRSVVLGGEDEAMVGVVVAGAGTVIGAAAVKTQE